MCAIALGPLCATAAAAETASLPAGFVFLRDIDPTILQDMRYASANNFAGRLLPGYDGVECVLNWPAAEALKQVQQDLAARNLSLKVFDCYRPARAVSAMARWANDGKSGEPTKRFFPHLQKNMLFALGYIASRSSHSLGTAVDLTIVDLADAAAPASQAREVPCTAPVAERGPGDGIDMGTAFDCFDVKSHTASSDVTAEQRRWRNLLVGAMKKHGFANYPREWWHFSYGGSGAGSTYYDFPIPRRPASHN